ncbi:helix-turn-helix domain-containing protein [Methylobacterium sp. D54C]
MTDTLKRSQALTITIEEASRRLGIGKNQAYDAANRGQIPTIKIGRRLLVPLAPFERMLGLSPGAGTEAA